MSLADRAECLKNMQPHLHADIMLYATEEGGRESPVPPGLSFICIVPEIAPRQGYDAWPQLGDEALAPGQQRRVGNGVPYSRRSGSHPVWKEIPSVGRAFHRRRIGGDLKSLHCIVA